MSLSECLNELQRTYESGCSKKALINKAADLINYNQLSKSAASQIDFYLRILLKNM